MINIDHLWSCMIENRNRWVNIDFQDHKLVKLYSKHNFFMLRSTMIEASINILIDGQSIIPSTTIDRPSIDWNQYWFFCIGSILIELKSNINFCSWLIARSIFDLICLQGMLFKNVFHAAYPVGKIWSTFIIHLRSIIINIDKYLSCCKSILITIDRINIDQYWSKKFVNITLMINYYQAFKTPILIFKVLSFSLSLVKAVKRQENHASNPRATILNLNHVFLTAKSI